MAIPDFQTAMLPLLQLVAEKGTVRTSEAIEILADRDRLRQVMWNLLTNAIKFTPSGGRIQIQVYAESSSAHVVVRDTGIGVSAEALPHIFKRFWQGETGQMREQGGLGLGLSLSKYLTELHGGSIHAASAGHGKGTEFRVSLPLTIAEVVPALDVLRIGGREESHPRQDNEA